MVVPSNICAKSLYLLSMLAHEYNIIIDHGFVTPDNSINIVDEMNEIEPSPHQCQCTNMKMPGSKGYENQIAIHTSIQKEDIILARVFPKQLSDRLCRKGVIHQCKYRKGTAKVNVLSVSIM